MRRLFYVWINKSKNCLENAQTPVAGTFSRYIMQGMNDFKALLNNVSKTQNHVYELQK